jgi:hypothetical protein
MSGAQGVGFGVWGLGLRVYGLQLRVQSLRVSVQVVRSRVQGFEQTQREDVGRRDDRGIVSARTRAFPNLVRRERE